MTVLRTIFTLALVTLLMACLDVAEESHYLDPTAQEADAPGAAGEPRTEAAGDVFTEAVRYCSEHFDCNSACACTNGTCQPDGFGPPPEGDYCAQPPKRACSSSSNCRSSCVCAGGFCQEDGFGPFPEGDYCARPLPDAYESNDSYTSPTSYLGSPQTGHNFHDPGDEDWILVYFGSAMTATFETDNNVNGANTYLEVYSYNYATGQLGAPAGANDDKCGFWWSSTCWGSRVVASVPANSVYAIRVSNTTDDGRSVYDQNAPGYSFRIY